MKKFILILLVLTINLFAKEIYYVNNENSNAYFKSKADMLFFIDDEIIGVNHKINGTLEINNQNIKGEILINSATFDTENEKRDSHIREILNHEKYKNIIINIKEELIKGNKTFLKSSLFINGILKEINIPIKKELKNSSLIYTGKIVVKYSDFNIKAPTVAGGVIKKAKDEIEIGARVTFEKVK